MRDCDIMPADPAENLPTALLAANPLLLLNGRYIVGGEWGGAGRLARAGQRSALLLAGKHNRRLLGCGGAHEK